MVGVGGVVGAVRAGVHLEIESTHDLSEQQQRGHNDNKGYFEQLE